MQLVQHTCIELGSTRMVSALAKGSGEGHHHSLTQSVSVSLACQPPQPQWQRCLGHAHSTIAASSQHGIRVRCIPTPLHGRMDAWTDACVRACPQFLCDDGETQRDLAVLPRLTTLSLSSGALLADTLGGLTRLTRLHMALWWFPGTDQRQQWDEIGAALGQLKVRPAA